MATTAIKSRDEGKQAAVDRAHLARMSFGDAALERELLELFERQAALLLERMREADTATLAALAHTLKGSASGVGAWGVARAAAAAERAASPAERSLALDGLAAAITEARAAISGMLASPVE